MNSSVLSQAKNLTFKRTIRELSKRTRVFIFSKFNASSFRVYEIITKEELTGEHLGHLARVLLVDSVAEDFSWKAPPGEKCCVVWLKSGVYDAEGDMALYAARRFRLADGIIAIKYGRGCALSAPCSRRGVESLYNPLVETLERL